MNTQIIHEKQSMEYLQWSQIRSSSGTAGSFLKATDDLQKPKKYYKLSQYDTVNGIIGHECVNELIADRLLNILGVEHLHYDLIHAEITVNDKNIETYLCVSEDFKKSGETKTALDTFYEMEHLENETPMDFCIRNGWEKYVYEMLVVDFLILNRDRHGANIEVLRNSKEKTLRLAPVFDHGLSLLFSCQTEKAVDEFDAMQDRPIQCFVGGNSAQKNLELIPKKELPQFYPLKEEHRNELLGGLEGIVPQYLLDKIWDMIWERWLYYEDFCNQK